MKFGELKIGAIFSYQGRTYIKSSPMIGRDETTGEQKFLRRSVEVDVGQNTVGTKTPVKKRTLLHTEAVNAFEEFYSHCERCLDTLAPKAGDDTVRSARERLALAKQRFLAKIG